MTCSESLLQRLQLLHVQEVRSDSDSFVVILCKLCMNRSRLGGRMYRVGDCVYFEDGPISPYSIRRIDELTKNAASGAVEAKVTIFYRRRDIPINLLKIADQAERNVTERGEFVTDEELEVASKVLKISGRLMQRKIGAGDINDSNSDPLSDGLTDYGLAGLPIGSVNLSPSDRFRLRQKELFLSRQVETLPATSIRGKCVVTLLSDIETPESFEDADSFFYSLVFDPNNNSLLADKGAIRVGTKYQAVVPEWCPPEKAVKVENGCNGFTNGDHDDVDGEDKLMIDDEPRASPLANIVPVLPHDGGEITTTERETLVWHPYHDLSDNDIDRFLIMSRSVGTFARALDTSSSTKLPSLHMTAASASRDVTILHAMALLHKANYKLSQGVKYLVPTANKMDYPLEVDKATGHATVSLGGPILVRDQLEEWSASEANLFDEALEKYGKDFNDIQQEFLPWKNMKAIVEFYYMFKTTNRHVDGRKKKLAEEKEGRLKQIYIPAFKAPVGYYNTVSGPGSDGCESCKGNESEVWYEWGPPNLDFVLCSSCFKFWKRMAGLLQKHSHDMFDMVSIGEKSTLSDKQLRAKLVEQRELMTKGGNQTQSNVISSGASSINQVITNKRPFNFRTTLLNRIARKITPKTILNSRRLGRHPFASINSSAIANHVCHVEISRILELAKKISGESALPAMQSFIVQRAAATKQTTEAAPDPETSSRVETNSHPTLPCTSDEVFPATAPTPGPVNSGQRRGLFRFFTGPNFRRRRNDLILRCVAKRVARSPISSRHDPTLQMPLDALAQSVQKSLPA